MDFLPDLMFWNSLNILLNENVAWKMAIAKITPIKHWLIKVLSSFHRHVLHLTTKQKLIICLMWVDDVDKKKEILSLLWAEIVLEQTLLHTRM